MGAVAHPWRPDPEQGVFETLLVVDGRPVELDAHLARIEASLEELYPDRDPPSLDVPVERGPYGHPRSGTSGADVLRIVVAPEGGGRLVAQSEVRRVRPGGKISLHSLPLAGGLGAHKWADRGLLDEAQASLPADALPLILDRDGAALEAARANLFAVRDGALFTPPLDGRILPGITRARVLELALAAGLDANEGPLLREDLLAADEVFLTGSVRGIEPVSSLDGAGLTGRGEVAAGLAATLLETWAAAKVG